MHATTSKWTVNWPANLGNHAREVLRITRLVTMFEIVGETEDAIASFIVASLTG